MINIPTISGNIRPVPLSSYTEIIDEYVNTVGKLDQVLNIIQMGSFTTPGISDIDLIVTIKDGTLFPPWSEISLKNICKHHNDAEIIAHDIFVIPESIAQNAEAYFYIDQQKVLKGKRLGGNIAGEMVAKCNEFLALEYAIFSLDSIANRLLGSTVDLRTIVLLISTMRHSAKIAFDLKLIGEVDKNVLIKQIEQLRSNVISKEYSSDDFSYLLEKFINLLYSTIEEISDKLTQNIIGKNLKNSWIVSFTTAMIGVKKEEDFLNAFVKTINKQKDSFLSRYVKIFTVPIESQMHIGAYLDGEEKPARYFRSSFKNFPSFHDKDELNTKARQLRGEVVQQHWDFITRTGYLQSSGKAYFGLSYPNDENLKSFFKKKMLRYKLRKL